MRSQRVWVVAMVVGLGACSSPQVDVTVSTPQVYGDDTVLQLLDRQRRELAVHPHKIVPGEVQERYAVGEGERTQATLGLNLADPTAPLPTPPAGVREPAPRADRGWRGRPWGRRWGRRNPRPLQPGLTFGQQLRQRVDGSLQRASYELRFLGDAALLAPSSRAALLRFDLSFNTHADLGTERRFVVVEFHVRLKDRPKKQPQRKAPRLSVYLLSPEYRAFVSDERYLSQVVSERAAQALGSWGGIGVSGGRGSRSEASESLRTLLETPLQFGIYDGKVLPGGGRRFAFAFGPRRRVARRGVFNLARWFGAGHELRYELQPRPRSCEAVLLLQDVGQTTPLELEVSVFCDGRLVAEEDVDLGLALRRGRRPLQTFAVTCPELKGGAATRKVQLDPRVTTDLLIASGGSPVFSGWSRVVLGGVQVDRADVRFLGRGRLAVRVRPNPALRIAPASGKPGQGRVVTPDQPDFVFGVELRPSEAK